jgi:glyoxalase superfamily protein
MATRIQVVFAASDPGRLAEFWRTVLHYGVEPPQMAARAGRSSPRRMESVKKRAQTWTRPSILVGSAPGCSSKRTTLASGEGCT